MRESNRKGTSLGRTGSWAMDARTVAIDPKDLESGIEALSSAGQAFRLTLFEKGAYYALIVSVYITAWAMTAVSLLVIFEDKLNVSGVLTQQLGAAAAVVSIWGLILSIVALGLNIPLAAKLYRERARLKEVGLASLSKSLW